MRTPRPRRTYSSVAAAGPRPAGRAAEGGLETEEGEWGRVRWRGKKGMVDVPVGMRSLGEAVREVEGGASLWRGVDERWVRM